MPWRAFFYGRWYNLLYRQYHKGEDNEKHILYFAYAGYAGDKFGYYAAA
jgi:hypothetical protein